MTDIRKQLQAAFEIEHREHLQAIQAALDSADRSTINLPDVFRRAHSLKGAARAVDLPAVEEVANRLESLFARLLTASRNWTSRSSWTFARIRHDRGSRRRMAVAIRASGHEAADFRRRLRHQGCALSGGPAPRGPSKSTPRLR